MIWHRLLLRQLRRHGISDAEQSALARLFDAISAAYALADQERELLGRSLQLTSDELVERHTQVQRQLQALQTGQVEQQASLSLLRATFESTDEGLLVIDVQGRLQQLNQRIIRIFGRQHINIAFGASAGSLLRKLARQTCDGRAVIQIVRTIAESAEDLPSRHVLGLKDGRFLEISAQPQLVDGQPVGRVWCLRDVTEQRHQEETIRFQAEHDSLTGLPNRRLFQCRLLAALANAERAQLAVGVLFIDLDYFKLVNDSLGHSVGDLVLCSVAREMQGMLRGDDLLARVGGDEFLLLLSHIDDVRHAEAVAERILLRLHRPLNIDGRKLWVHASIGVATYPHDGATPDQLIRRADMAMYQAKSRGRNNVQSFSPAVERQMRRRLELHEQLRRALENDEFRLLLQPKIRLEDRHIVSAEALLRWTTPSGEEIPPGDFIPVAESSGLIKDIGDWVLRTGLDWVSRQALPTSFTLAINLSAHQLDSDGLVERIEAMLSERQLAGTRLELEITESVLMLNPESAVQRLGRLRELGVKVSIDDFGTGYSSLNYLRWLPVDILKIDRSFVQDLGVSATVDAIVRSIIGLAHNLGLDVVAEGIEEEATADLLLEFGCALGQGYLFGRPMEIAEFNKLFGRRQVRKNYRRADRMKS